jgi:hypothetical protein
VDDEGHVNPAGQTDVVTLDVDVLVDEGLQVNPGGQIVVVVNDVDVDCGGQFIPDWHIDVVEYVVMSVVGIVVVVVDEAQVKPDGHTVIVVGAVVDMNVVVDVDVPGHVNPVGHTVVVVGVDVTDVVVWGITETEEFVICPINTVGITPSGALDLSRTQYVVGLGLADW